MPPLTILEIRHSRVSCRPLIPDNNRPLLPLYAAAKVQAADVVVQEREKVLRLLGQKTLDLAGDGGVDEESGFAGYRVLDYEGMSRVDGFCEGTLRANSSDFAFRGGRVLEF